MLVCPAAELGRTLEVVHPSHVVTIASPRHPVPPVPAAIARLHLAFNDIAGPRSGLVPPDRGHVEALLAFGRTCRDDEPLVISCELGISRSPAAAFVLACQAAPDRDPAAVAALLREASPQATPNALLVALADALLGRRGTMVEAARRIGRGAEFVTPTPFALRIPRPLVPARSP